MVSRNEAAQWSTIRWVAAALLMSVEPTAAIGAVSQGSTPDGANASATTACTSGVPINFNAALNGVVVATDGSQWTVPVAVDPEATATDLYNDCTDSGDNPDFASQLQTVVIDPDGVAITGFIFADNQFELYVNGTFVVRDPIAFTPFNSTVARFRAKYPITYAVKLIDWETRLGLGMEYDTYHVGDGGFIAQFSDGTVTNAAWKVQPYYIAPLDNPSCVAAHRDSTACATRPAWGEEGTTARFSSCGRLARAAHIQSLHDRPHRPGAVRERQQRLQVLRAQFDLFAIRLHQPRPDWEDLPASAKSALRVNQSRQAQGTVIATQHRADRGGGDGDGAERTAHGGSRSQPIGAATL